MVPHFNERHVKDAMHRNVQTVEPDEPMLNVAKLLRVSGIQGLVVVAKDTRDQACSHPFALLSAPFPCAVCSLLSAS